MTLRETIAAIRTIAALTDPGRGWPLGTWAPPTYILLFECGRCGRRRQDHRALHLLHARRRLATKRGFFHDRAWETKGQVMGNCTFLPLWARLLDVPQRAYLPPMAIPGMGAFAAMAKKKLGAGLPPGKGGPPGGPKPDKAHPHTSGKPGQFAGDKKQDAQRVAAEQVSRVRAGKVDQQLVKLMKGYDPEDGYPQWAPNEKVWEEAEAAVQPDGAGRKLDDPWLVIAHVYKALGGKVSAGAQPGDGKGEGDEGGEDYDEEGGEDHDHDDGDDDEDDNPGHGNPGYKHGNPGHGEAGHGKGELTDEDKRLGAAVDPMHNPPEWVDDEALWEKAKKAAGDSDAEDYYAMVTHIYKQMGGKVKGG